MARQNYGKNSCQHRNTIIKHGIFFWNWSKTGIAAHSNFRKLKQNHYQRCISSTGSAQNHQTCRWKS